MRITKPKGDSEFIKNSIPAIYQNNFLELTLWAWVQGLHLFGDTGIDHAIELYKTHFNLTDKQASTDTLRMIYFRKGREFIQFKIDQLLVKPADENGILNVLNDNYVLLKEILNELKNKSNPTPP